MNQIASVGIEYSLAIRNCLLAVLLLMGLYAGPVFARAVPVSVKVSAATVEFEGVRIEGVHAFVDKTSAGLNISKVLLLDQGVFRIENLALICDPEKLATDDLCAGGSWSLDALDVESEWVLPVRGSIERAGYSGDDWLLDSTLVLDQFDGKLLSQFSDGKIRTEISWAEQPILDLPASPRLPIQLQWVESGSISGQISVVNAPETVSELNYLLDIADLAFDSPEGRFAGEGLRGHFVGDVRLDKTLFAETRSEIRSGALLLDNFYTSFDERSLEIQVGLSKTGQRLELGQIRVRDGRSLEIEAQAIVDLQNPGDSLEYQVDHLALHFPEVYENYLESMASAWTLDGLTVTGSLLWSGDSKAGVFGSGVLDVLDMTIVDNKRGRFAFTGLDAHILPGEKGFDSNFSWRGLLLERINLGSGQALVEATADHFALSSPLGLDVLGGSVVIETLVIKLPGSERAENPEPEIRLHVSMDNMDMALLTEAFGWPRFDGSISGKIPGVTLNDGVLAVDGEIEFNVFDGQVLLSDLLIERPFGVLPSLAANLEAKNLDMQLLTHTFSLGQISGRMNGYVHDLRMLDWKPVTFDAWIGTPEGSGSNDISRQAVNHLTTIGGGTATAALTGPVMRLFNNFSYKRLGLGCELKNNICRVRGLDEDEASVLIMEGAGIPKIMIRAFNRQMDWPSLVAGLTAASEGESIKIGK